MPGALLLLQFVGFAFLSSDRMAMDNLFYLYGSFIRIVVTNHVE